MKVIPNDRSDEGGVGAEVMEGVPYEKGGGRFTVRSRYTHQFKGSPFGIDLIGQLRSLGSGVVGYDLFNVVGKGAGGYQKGRTPPDRLGHVLQIVETSTLDYDEGCTGYHVLQKVGYLPYLQGEILRMLRKTLGKDVQVG